MLYFKKFTVFSEENLVFLLIFLFCFWIFLMFYSSIGIFLDWRRTSLQLLTYWLLQIYLSLARHLVCKLTLSFLGNKAS